MPEIETVPQAIRKSPNKRAFSEITSTLDTIPMTSLSITASHHQLCPSTFPYALRMLLRRRIQALCST